MLENSFVAQCVLILFSAIHIVYYGIEISMPQLAHKLLVLLETDPESISFSPFEKFAALMPLFHISQLFLLLFSGEVRFVAYGMIFTSFLLFEGILLSFLIKIRELITLKAAISLLIQLDILRSILVLWKVF